MSWRQFSDVILLLETDCRVIAVSLDGFDDTGETEYLGAKKEAKRLAEYIKSECGGHLDCLFAESLGCCPAAVLMSNAALKIDRMILSGPECLNCGIFNELLIRLIPKKQAQMVRNFKNPNYKFPWYLMKITGQTQKGMHKLTQ